MELKKEYFKRYEPTFWFKVKTLFAKTTTTTDTSKDGTSICKFKNIWDQVYLISSEWKPNKLTKTSI
jgi:hypothetical protein